MNLRGKKALVTGGAVRLGGEVVKMLQECGAEVIVHYRHSMQDALKCSSHVIAADLSIPDESAHLFERVNEQFGTVDILVNNASVFTKDRLPDSTIERVQSEFQVNLFAPLELIRCFALQAPMNGVVINLLDRRIQSNDTSCVPYLLTKQGLYALTKLAALEYAPYIRVSAVAPGGVLAPPGEPAELVYTSTGTIPLGALPTPKQIADAAKFLLTAESVTGQVIYVDGGQHLLGNGV